MSQDVQLTAEKRDETGKKVAANLRGDGRVPAVVQEHGKDSIAITVGSQEILKAFALAGKSQAIDLSVGSTKKLALIKEITFVPTKNEVQHVVFQALKADEEVDADVPVHVVGEIPAENNRLVLLNTIDTLAVRALPKDLPEALEVDGSGLAEIDDRVTIGDIKLPEGVQLVEILANADDEEKQSEFLSQPIALVKEPSIVESDEGVELAEGESEGDAVDSENGGEGDDESSDSSDDSGSEESRSDD